jgi:hypothetical protein
MIFLFVLISTVVAKFFNVNEIRFKLASERLYKSLDSGSPGINEADIDAFWAKFNLTAEHHDQMMELKGRFWDQIKTFDNNTDGTVSKEEFLKGSQSIKNNVRPKFDKSICEKVKNYTDSCNFREDKTSSPSLILTITRVNYANFMCKTGFSYFTNYRQQVCILNAPTCQSVIKCLDYHPSELLLDPRTNEIMRNYGKLDVVTNTMVGIFVGILTTIINVGALLAILAILVPLYFIPMIIKLSFF